MGHVLADGVGFEPTRHFRVYALSRRAPSTARPPIPHRRGLLPTPSPARKPVVPSVWLNELARTIRQAPSAEILILACSRVGCAGEHQGRRLYEAGFDVRLRGLGLRMTGSMGASAPSLR